MTDVMVSVVIPIFNVEKYLDRCIESVVKQTYKNLEIILVDDGSTDGCSQKCDGWAIKDARIKVVHKVNAGLGMARNTGIDNANGKYIFFFDSDDYVDETIVEKCLKSAIENNADVVVFGRNDVYDDEKIIPHSIKAHRDVFSGEEIVKELLPAMFSYRMGFGVSAWGKMYDFEMIKRLNKRFVSEREIISEDAYFAVDLYPDINTVSLVCENLYFYRKRDNSLSRVYNPDRQNKNDVFYLKTVDLVEKKKINKDIIKYVAVRYQMYCVAAMKQICNSTLNSKQKNTELDRILKNDILKSTLKQDIISIHNSNIKMFYFLLKNKFYWICKKMIFFKAKV